MADKPNNAVDFWNVNVPAELQTQECPDFLTYALENEKDRSILATRDADWHRLSWEEAQRLTLQNRLDLFERMPSDLRRYREYCFNLERKYGSVMEFVVKHRLKWQNLEPVDKPFAVDSMCFQPRYRRTHELIAIVGDMKILRNDWPYGIDPRIVHLVVWTKFELPAAPSSDADPDEDLSPETRAQIQAYVDEVFINVCGAENVIWFKNWKALKSIHSVEHFHVMLFNPSDDFVDRVTGGDVSASEDAEIQKKALGGEPS